MILLVASHTKAASLCAAFLMIYLIGQDPCRFGALLLLPEGQQVLYKNKEFIYIYCAYKEFILESIFSHIKNTSFCFSFQNDD